MTGKILTVLAMLLMAMTTPALADDFDHSQFDGLLRKYVSSHDDGRSTRIDYAAIKNSKASLSEYLDRTTEVTQKAFDAWSKSEQLAFLINVYNARTIELVLEGYPDIASIKDLGSVLSSPWSKEFVQLFGSKHSLDDIEHGLIRGSGRYGDPRIHFAVNCASIGCPALRAEAYSGDRLEGQLEDQTQKFLSDCSRNRLKGDTIEASSIFRWYREDFEAGFRGAESLGAFLSLFPEPLGLKDDDRRRLEEAEMKIVFIRYDWRLNAFR